MLAKTAFLTFAGTLLVLLLLTGCGSPALGAPDLVTHVPPSPPALAGDPAEGERLFTTFQPAAGIACSTCHRVDSEERLVGPGLLHLAGRAGSRVSGQDAAAYVRASIVNPSAYVVEGYTDIMPKNWGQVFSEAEIDDLVAFLLSL